MKYSEEIQAAVKAIEHDIAYFASGIRLQYPDRSQADVEQEIKLKLDSKIRVDDPNREAEANIHND